MILDRYFKIISNLYILFLSIFIFACSVGINIIIFPALLVSNNISPSKIGIATAVETTGAIFMSFFLAKIVKKIGVISVLLIATSIYSFIIFIANSFLGFIWWLILIFILGCCWFSTAVIRQAWLNFLTNNKDRGMVIGTFSMIISLGLATGPMIVSVAGARSQISFIISAFLMITSFLIIKLFFKQPSPVINIDAMPIKEFFLNNPIASLARFFLDFQVFLLITLTVPFATKINISFEQAAMLIGAFMLSGFCDLIIGAMLTRFNPYKVVNIGFLIKILAILAMILMQDYGKLLILYFLFGVGVACNFVATYKIINDKYADNIIVANATFQRIGSIGSLCGGLFGGIMIEIFGSNGFLIALILGSITFLTFIIFNQKNLNYKNKYLKND